jgi:hypothetical protein
MPVTELEGELSAFPSMPNLEQALAELEERNSEIEELLRNKCVEIEEMTIVLWSMFSISI